jgi:hypothetical protein
LSNKREKTKGVRSQLSALLSSCPDIWGGCFWSQEGNLKEEFKGVRDIWFTC